MLWFGDDDETRQFLSSNNRDVIFMISIKRISSECRKDKSVPGLVHHEYVTKSGLTRNEDAPTRNTTGGNVIVYENIFA